ncbi:hypothetical protein BDB01DRAFT_832610 [Pilobolus umbonatus]|nr:hypothetical protein BDB01DRAFT_832610 [Pilobolus umbonatus]
MNKLHKRSALSGGTFATRAEHTPIFNTVHIISAVIGIVGIIAVAVTIVFIWKKKRKNTDIEHNTMQPVQLQFDQFATDFNNTLEPPPPPSIDINPVMQQYQLHLQILTQQDTRHKDSLILPGSNTSLPPPPYQP